MTREDENGQNDSDETPAKAPEGRPPTRGERIRRQREEKAKAKADKRGREAEQLEERAIGIAEQARDATQEIVRESGGKIALALVGALVVVVAIAVTRDMMAGEREAAAGALSEADAIAEPRARAEALESLVGDEAEGRLAIWARLGAGAARLRSGDAEGAAGAYDAALRTESLEPFEQRLALEGLAAARIAEGDLDAASDAYSRLADVDARGAKDAAELGRARVLASRGERGEARALVDAVVARRKEAGREGRGYTLEESEALASALEGG